ncbi:MAG: molybdenum cofactor biosynthesis protein MoaE [bacterium]
MIIQAEVSQENFDLSRLLQRFEQKETHQTGSIVIHRGKVKSPGKKVANLSSVLLKERLEGDAPRELYKIGERAGEKFHYLQQVYISHRLGNARPGDDILLVIVSAADRVSAFSAAHWIVDEIKKEEIITLKEIG